MREVTLPRQVRPSPQGGGKIRRNQAQNATLGEGIPLYVVFGCVKGLEGYIIYKYSTENIQKRYYEGKWE